MIEGYSFMDWVTFGGVLTTIASLVGIAIKLARDNSGLKAEMKALSKGILLTVKGDEKVNSMVISWGALAIEWNKPIFVTDKGKDK